MADTFHVGHSNQIIKDFNPSSNGKRLPKTLSKNDRGNIRVRGERSRLPK